MDRLQYRAKSKLTYSETQSRNVYYFTCKNAACLGDIPEKTIVNRRKAEVTPVYEECLSQLLPYQIGISILLYSMCYLKKKLLLL